nr:50S ribosomal protein L18-like [Ipomoea batatas]
MVIPPPVRPERVTKFLKPYVLRMHFTNKYVNAQVVHTPTATVAAAASTQEKGLRLGMIEAKENTRDVAAAAKIGKLLGERLRVKGVPAVSIFFKRDQRYHGKVKAVIDSIRGEGIELDVCKRFGPANLEFKLLRQIGTVEDYTNKYGIEANPLTLFDAYSIAKQFEEAKLYLALSSLEKGKFSQGEGMTWSIQP